MTEQLPPPTRRAFVKSTAALLATLTFSAPLEGKSGPREAAARTGDGAKDDSLKNYPFTEIDRSKWPALSSREKDILKIHLSVPEAKALLKYKINSILDNKAVLDELKENHGLKTNSMAKLFMEMFYGNVMKEFGDGSAWNSRPEANEMNVGNVMDKMWKRLSMHVQFDDIEMECRGRQGKKLNTTFSFHDRMLAVSYNLYPKVFGPPETWRGNVPYDPDHLDYKDDTAVQNIARRRPQLDFVRALDDLGITPLVPDFLKVTDDDLKAIGIGNIDERIEQSRSSAGWARRASASAPAAAGINK